LSQIFIAHDPVTEKQLVQVAEKLALAGHRVLRGPEVTAGVKQTFPPEAYAEYFADTDVIVVTSRNVCSREVMLASPKLRAVMTPTIGVDAVDLDAASELGIIVGHGALPELFLSVAESTVLAFAALFYRLKETEQLLRADLPRPWVSRARMMRGKTIGLIGFGRIGRAVAERLQNWEVNLQTYDPYVTASSLPSTVAPVDLATLLKTSDLVSLHVTLSKETHHMIGEAEIRTMKPGSFLVNMSRGGLVDEDAVYRACKDGHLGGAALDVFETEPLPLASPLREIEDNVFLTPHFLSHAIETNEAMPGALLENIRRVLAGEPPLYTKNPGDIPKWKERLARLASKANG